MITEKEIYQKAISGFGTAKQVSMAKGEMGELIAALTRYFTQHRGSADDVIEEISDVEIMIGQLKTLFGVDRCNEMKLRKLKRLELFIRQAEEGRK